MALDPLRLIEHIHGHLGWLAAALLVHPAILLRNRARRAHLAVAIATGLVTVGAGLGAWLYGAYRVQLKQSMFLHARSYALLFERKEHLAFGSLMFAWAGCIAYFAAFHPAASEPVRGSLRTIAFRAYLAAAALALLVAALGTVVATTKSF
jgi:hypothetical protein